MPVTANIRDAGRMSSWRQSTCRGFNSASDLRTLRKMARLSQAELGQLSKFSPHAVRYWERQPGRIDGVAPAAFRKALEARGISVPASGARPATTAPQPAPTTCGAKNRLGNPCQCKPMPGKRRCKFHGGMSTGPKTSEGRIRIAEAQRARWIKPHGVLSNEGFPDITTREAAR